MTLLLVQYDFQYTAKDGRLVSIKPDERYILVSKTNEHWWHVRRDRRSRPFYVPAQYVKEIPHDEASAQGAAGEACRAPTRGGGGEVAGSGGQGQTGSAQTTDQEHGSESRDSQQPKDDDNMDFPPPPVLPIRDPPPGTEDDGPLEPDQPGVEGEPRWRAADEGSSAEPSTDQVKTSSDVIHALVL